MQNPGHPGCANNSQPLANLSAAIASIESTPSQIDPNLHRILPSFDKAVKEILSHSKSQQLSQLLSPIRYIDMSPLYARVDAHPTSRTRSTISSGHDCLHYCLPGPVDFFAVQLMHLLAHGGFPISHP